MTLKRKTVDAAGIKITITTDVKDFSEIKQMVWRPGGGGNKDLLRRATAVAELANRTAPVGKTGKLSRSFTARQARTVEGKFDTGYEVFSNVGYSWYVIKGTAPHRITGNPFLAFDWPKAGLHPAVFRFVNHPGTAPNSFFADSVRAAV